MPVGHNSWQRRIVQSCSLRASSLQNPPKPQKECACTQLHPPCGPRRRQRVPPARPDQPAGAGTACWGRQLLRLQRHRLAGPRAPERRARVQPACMPGRLGVGTAAASWEARQIPEAFKEGVSACMPKPISKQAVGFRCCCRRSNAPPASRRRRRAHQEEGQRPKRPHRALCIALLLLALPGERRRAGGPAGAATRRSAGRPYHRAIQRLHPELLR